MYTIRPIDFIANQAKVTDDNLGTDATTEWTSGTVTAGDQVKVTTTANGASAATYKIYEAITTVGDDPTADVANYPTTPGIGTNWKEVGSVNEWAWANNVVADRAVGATTTINIEITPDEVVSAIALANIENAESLTLLVVDPSDGTVHNETYDLTSYLGIDSFYDWLFEPVVRLDRYAVFNLPPYVDAVIDITLTTSSGVPEVGLIVAGQQFFVGDSLYGTRYGFDDYSESEFVPSLGRKILTEGDYAEESRTTIYIADDRLASVRKRLVEQRNKATAWMSKLDDTGTLVFGYMKEMVITLRTKNGTFIDLEVGDLT